MKKYKYISLVLVSAGLLLVTVSCNKTKLNPNSSTSIPYDQKFDNADRIASLVNGLYSNAKTGNLWGGRYLIYNDVRGDNFINETNNVVTALAIWNFTVTGSDNEINSTWNDAYAAINQVNIFLDGMQQKGNAVVGDDLAKQYAGEAKFLRALMYYTLVQLYAEPYVNGNGSKPGLPMRLTPIVSAGSNVLARSSVADVYKQILIDLNDAETALPDTYDDGSLNTTRAHRSSAIALKVKVYLTMNQYDNVITEANKIVTATAPFHTNFGVQHALAADIKNVFTNYTTTESVFSFPFTGANEQPGTQNQLAYYYLPDLGNGEFSLNDDGVISDAGWKSSDARRSFVEVDGDGISWLRKYSVGSPYTDWVPVIRYSEILLDLAEARVRSTNSVDAQAIALLNAVRQRSDATTTFAAGDFASASELEDALLQERNIELLGEGVRGLDFMRLGMSFPAKGSVKVVAPAAPGYIFPAPTSETQYNTAW